jgi:hypothetical protein
MGREGLCINRKDRGGQELQHKLDKRLPTSSPSAARPAPKRRTGGSFDGNAIAGLAAVAGGTLSYCLRSVWSRPPPGWCSPGGFAPRSVEPPPTA